MDGRADALSGKKELTGFFLSRWFKALYNWVLHWADTPYGEPMLGFISFIESSFFPIIPDVLLLPLALAKPKRAFRYALITSVCSVLGGMLGYFIGMFLFDTVGLWIINLYRLMDQYHTFQGWYEKYNFWIVFIAGVSPLPYKVFTIAAGVAKVNFALFVLGSVVSRSFRFFAEAAMCYWGDYLTERIFKMSIKEVVEKYLNLVITVLVILGVAGFVVVKYVIPHDPVKLSLSADLTADGKDETVRLRGKPGETTPEQGSKTINYLLEIYSEQSGVLAQTEVKTQDKPLHEFSHGEPRLHALGIDASTKLIALELYSDCTQGQACTDGFIMFYWLNPQGTLDMVYQMSFPLFRRFETIGEKEAALEITAENRDADAENEIIVKITHKEAEQQVIKTMDQPQAVKLTEEQVHLDWRPGRLLEIGRQKTWPQQP